MVDILLFFFLRVHQGKLAECHSIGHSSTYNQENAEVRKVVLHVVAHDVPHSDAQLILLVEILFQNNHQVDKPEINWIFNKPGKQG